MTWRLRAACLEACGVPHGFYSARDASGLTLDGAGDRQGALDVVAADLQLPATSICLAKQVHSHRVVVVDETVQPEAVAIWEADALITGVRGRAVGVLTADCLPVLVAAPDVGWVGAVHAGRRGALAEIVSATMAALLEQGASRSALRFALGPHIRAASYEVGEELFETLPQAAQYRAEDGRFCCDLHALVCHELRAFGVSPAQVETCAPDTWSSEMWHSYRRDGLAAGRQLSVIAPAARA